MADHCWTCERRIGTKSQCRRPALLAISGEVRDFCDGCLYRGRSNGIVLKECNHCRRTEMMDGVNGPPELDGSAFVGSAGGTGSFCGKCGPLLRPSKLKEARDKARTRLSRECYECSRQVSLSPCATGRKTNLTRSRLLLQTTVSKSPLVDKCGFSFVGFSLCYGCYRKPYSKWREERQKKYRKKVREEIRETQEAMAADGSSDLSDPSD